MDIDKSAELMIELMTAVTKIIATTDYEVGMISCSKNFVSIEVSKKDEKECCKDGGTCACKGPTLLTE